jgi:N12 class adenine-specific DNA methylase/predicted RNA methylase
MAKRIKRQNDLSQQLSLFGELDADPQSLPAKRKTKTETGIQAKKENQGPTKRIKALMVKIQKALPLFGELDTDPQSLPAKHKAKTETDIQAKKETQEQTKREKALADYKAFIDELGDNQRTQLEGLILEHPGSPSLQMVKIQKALASKSFDNRAIPVIKKEGSTLNKEQSNGSLLRYTENIPSRQEAQTVPTDGIKRRASAVSGIKDQDGAAAEADLDRLRDAGRHGRGDGSRRSSYVVLDDYTITDQDHLGQGGPKQKFRDNVAAIRLLSELQHRKPTQTDQAILLKYVGWGGLPQAFQRPDGTVAKGWQSEVNELKSLLSSDDYTSARSTTQDAHYTSTLVVRGIYSALDQFGVRQGHFLEPSVGIGNFIGLMDPKMRSQSKITGVEIDPTSAAIAQYLYPRQNIISSGFHEFAISPESFDVVIGNPPFGSKTLFDPNHPDLRGFSIHNFFFAKSIKALRPNGMLAMVVSSSMMDKHGGAQREWISRNAELIGAIRLPNTAFKENALTEVTTDIIFLRKRSGVESEMGHQWQDLAEVTGPDGVRYRINEYFKAHPEMILGELAPNKLRPAEVENGIYDGPPGLNGIVDERMIDRAISRLPKDIYRADHTPDKVQQSKIVVSNMGFTRPYGYTLDDGGQAVRRLPDVNGETVFEPVLYAGKPIGGIRLERFTGLMEIRDTLRGLIKAEIEDDPKMSSLRTQLNWEYDRFVKKFGFVSSTDNASLFRDDPTDYPLIRSLEVNYQKGISKAEAVRTGESPKAPSADKSAIFSVRAREPYRRVTHAETAADALVIVLREDGAVNINRIAAIANKGVDEAAKELSGLIFQNPETRSWETADVYLSGNVKKKLAQARAEAERDLQFLDNVRSLEKVQPTDVPAEKIFFQIGATWIPTGIYERFAKDMLKSNTKIMYSAEVNVYQIEGDSRVTTAFQTDHMTGVEIFSRLLRNKDILVYDRDADGKPYLQMEWTTQARSKADEMQRAFQDWVLDDQNRREIIEREFNAKVNTTVEMKPDGSHMIFPNMGTFKTGVKRDDQLMPHQKNAAWRMILDGGGLLDHVVGSGKTFTAVAAGMEMKRMGLINKPLYVVPNHLVQQWSCEFQRLYPGANVLAIGKKDFAKSRRQEFLGRIATGDWDAVLMAHSSFGFIKMPHEYEIKFYQEQVNHYSQAIKAMCQDGDKKSLSVKKMESAQDQLKEKIKSLAHRPKDNVVDFSELGVDALFVDEAHEFKNLFYATRLSRVAGLGNPVGSKKAFDMFVKTRFIQEQNKGRGVFFLTGTPVSNSIAEMYTMMRYMKYDTLQEMGIKHFDQWANMFAMTSTDWEVDASGTRYRLQNKLEFANLPGLMAFYKDFADIISTDDLKAMAAERGQVWPIPDIRGNKPFNVVAERSEIQENFMQWIVHRFDTMPKDPRLDNPLKATGDAMKGSLDIRLINPSLPDFEGSKVNLAVRNIVDIYHQWSERAGTQLVFCDLSVPQGAKSKLQSEVMFLRQSIKKAEQRLEKIDDADSNLKMEVEREYIALTEKLNKISPAELMAVNSKFSVYDDMKEKMISGGVRPTEIAFIHDANTDLQKEELFNKVKSGAVRVLIGSTSKMGAGMNVQDRLVALHHIDVPWRPSDLEQREGRIIRQGNLFYCQALERGEKFEVEIYRYATNQTLDTRRWQIIERKATSIAKLRLGDYEWGATLADPTAEVANAAEMKAASSGNPLILDEVKLRQHIKQTEALKKGAQSQRLAMERKIKEAAKFDATFERIKKDFWENKAYIDTHPRDHSPEGWKISVNNVVFKAKGLVPVPDENTSSKADIRSAEKNNSDAFRFAMARYSNELRNSKKVEFIGYRGVDFFVERTGFGYVLSPDLKSINHYNSSLRHIMVGGELSPRGLMVRMDNYLEKISEMTASLSKDLHERREYLRLSAKNAKIELTKIADFDTELKTLRAQHADVLKELENNKNTQAVSKPDGYFSLWEGGKANQVKIQSTYLNINVKLPDDSQHEKLVKVLGMTGSEQYKAAVKEQVKGLMEHAVSRGRVAADDIKKIEVNVSRASNDQIAEFEKQEAKSHKIGLSGNHRDLSGFIR